MRIIKFRGKSEDTHKWIYGDLLQYEDGSCNIKTKEKDKIGCNIMECVIPETVGQFTGLTDKNGVEIYEGDVYKTTKYSGTPGKFIRFIGQILYAPTSFIVNGVKQYFGMNSDLNALGIVIGNIHDNPELLK